ncbi:glycosyltransferase [Clostridium chromiireducens]|uniref:Glycogen synthase n=1 Tax=Clostridium chromiireducens TaxID=225345 RepID=A0A1V4J021_9CLOT|nr:glycosyltransferase [Clostridium chromiireducens]OPJ65364.1 glycogen synthase [Clostridium chromiireducens]
MKILHYALGFPPYRTGGLTKYCTDLMIAQREQGHDVGLLWPGQIRVAFRKSSIKQGIDINWIHSFEIINPLPVALDEGIINVEMYMTKGNKEIYKDFLEKFSPNAIHIHTLMGIHKEFIIAAKELNIKTVFTTHDYYGICPKVTLFYNGSVCDNDHGCEDCINCNQTALSLKKIMLLQSPMYRQMKNLSITKALRRKHRNQFFEATGNVKCQLAQNEINSRVEKYKQLREYYIDILKNIDVIHFNSSVSEMVYKRYFIPKDGRVVNITHKGIADNRKKKKFNHGKLKITYLAPAKPYKGFSVLKQALDELWDEGNRNFELNMYSVTNKISPYMEIQDGYNYEELESIFDKTDLLVAPSVCYETFGFTVLEALSYGVPVLVSENVGAKDIVLNPNWVIEASSVQELKNIINNIKIEDLEAYNAKILELNKICEYKTFVKQNDKLYQ